MLQVFQLLAGLKNEKLVKDRLLQQKNETGRNVSIIFYFINYRAIVNVLKYKIDHMRLVTFFRVLILGVFCVIIRSALLCPL